MDFSLLTQFDARQALPLILQKINQLSSHRAHIGALESRLTAAVGTTRVGIESMTTAASQIRDVDVAAEAARLVRSKVIQQAGVAVLGQANQSPALALTLLQDI